MEAYSHLFASLRLPLAALVALSMIGCGTIIRDRTDDYQLAKNGQELEIPGNLKSNAISPKFPIPDTDSNVKVTGEYQLPEPPDATAILIDDPFTIDSVGDKSWLQVYTAPGKLWPLLDLFWEQNGIQTESEEIAKGKVKTKSLGESVKGRALVTALGLPETLADNLRVEAVLAQGIRRNTAELQVQLRGGGIDDQSAEARVEAEKKLLGLIGEFVTSDEATDRYSLLANDIGGEAKVSLQTKADGSKYIQLSLDFERAWNTVGKSLKSAQVVLADVDRSQSSYYVSSLKPEDDSGWFSFLRSNEPPPRENNFAVKLQSKSSQQIEVTVEVLDSSQPPELAEELLNVVLEHIS